MKFSQKLRHLRKSMNMSMQELADKAEVSQAAICNYENEKIKPTLYTLRKLAKALDTSVKKLQDSSKLENKIYIKRKSFEKGIPTPTILHKDNDTLTLDYVVLFKKLNEERKKIVLNLVRELL